MQQALKNYKDSNNSKEFCWQEFPEERRKAQTKSVQHFIKLCMELQITRARRNLAVALKELVELIQGAII